MMARQRKKELGEKSRLVLEVLERYQKETGRPPSIREIQAQAKISSTSLVDYYLRQLEENQYIERDNRVSRGIRVLKSLSIAVENLLRIPIAGRIVAGLPVPVPASDFSFHDAATIDNADHMVEVARNMLPRGEKANDLYALEVQGDSMIDAMVNDGDIVIMKPAHEARNGEMVAVWLTDKEETTLKYFYRENDNRVRLQPANPTMKPILIKDPSTVQIQGKVVMVIRRLQSRPL
ncbi:MAG: transcriptional repressor LexA [Chloroflexi bacterium]|nr:transcriptional repressor LexA [Chloroflexota bacterium]